jgi:hypothetical protein
MNLESHRGRSVRQQLPERKTETRGRRNKVQGQRKVDSVGKCCDGTCEVSWKPYPTQESIAKVANS